MRESNCGGRGRLDVVDVAAGPAVHITSPWPAAQRLPPAAHQSAGGGRGEAPVDVWVDDVQPT